MCIIDVGHSTPMLLMWSTQRTIMCQGLIAVSECGELGFGASEGAARPPRLCEVCIFRQVLHIAFSGEPSKVQASITLHAHL